MSFTLFSAITSVCSPNSRKMSSPSTVSASSSFFAFSLSIVPFAAWADSVVSCQCVARRRCAQQAHVSYWPGLRKLIEWSCPKAGKSMANPARKIVNDKAPRPQAPPLHSLDEESILLRNALCRPCSVQTTSNIWLRESAVAVTSTA